MTLLNNEDFVAKLAQVLSVTFQLLLEEKLSPVIQRLDTIIKDNKDLNDRINVIEKENKKVQIQNEGLAEDVKLLRSKINMLEQTGCKNSIIMMRLLNYLLKERLNMTLFKMNR